MPARAFPAPVTARHAWHTLPGRYRLHVGRSSRDLWPIVDIAAGTEGLHPVA